MVHFEAHKSILSRFFPVEGASGSVPTFQVGISGGTLGGESVRPNPVSTAQSYGPALLLENVQASDTEGGAYCDAMRTLLGYTRYSADVTCEFVSGGVEFSTGPFVWQNALSWSPKGNWDDPETPYVVEPGPYPWHNDPWEALHGYPWCVPTIKGDYFEDILGTDQLNWLSTNLHKAGGYPITLCYLADTANDCLFASQWFRPPVLWRPGGRIVVPGLTFRFAQQKAYWPFVERFGRHVILGESSAYTSMKIALLKCDYVFDPKSSDFDAAIAAFDSGLSHITLGTWTFQEQQGDDGPYITQGPLTTTNNTESDVTIGGLCVYGTAGSVNEPMWYAAIDPVVVPDGDDLILDEVKFALEVTHG